MNHPSLRTRAALLRALALPLLLAAATASQAQQGLPAAPGTWVQLQLSSCGTTLLQGQGTIDDDCVFNPNPVTQGSSGANGSNLGGILRGNTTAATRGGAFLTADSRSTWNDRWTFLGGAVPASAVFSFQLFGSFNATVSGTSSTAGNEALYQALVRPFGSWGTAASTASGTLNPRHVIQTPGPTVNEFVPVLQGLTLPVSLAGIVVGNSLDLSTSFLLRSQASSTSGTADATGVFFNSAGLTDLHFLDAQGLDITPQVQFAWEWGTQLMTAVPEATTAWLMLAGLGVVLLLSARRAGGGPARPGPQGPQPTARWRRAPVSGW